MSYFLPHLPTGWHVDQAILSEDDRVVIIRFGNDWDPQCMKMDETLYAVSEKVQNFAVIYLVDITQVPDFNKVSTSLLYRISADSFFRCTNFTTLVRLCSSTGDANNDVVYSATHCLCYVRNKHIMIDLGTGNNNKM
jgi:U5 snRNP protein, DIM1 family